MTVPADTPKPRRPWTLPRSGWWLGIALVAAALITAGALVAAS